MLLLTHLVFALGSIVVTTLTFLRPSVGKLHVSYALIGSTLTSGTLLVVLTHSPLLSSCISGLAYISVVASGVLVARRKLARQNI